ncbi:MAG: allantoicase [Bacteroidota bacterium]
MMNQTNEPNIFPGLIDLASERLGGKVLLASDDFFASADNLLKQGRGVFIPEKYTPQGKWMDGWESRRKRVPGYDWCLVKLGAPGIIRGFEIDTNNFLGNSPLYVSVEACVADTNTSATLLVKKPVKWTTVLAKSPVKPGVQNVFGVMSAERWTHIRLNIFPDGGVARLRVYGTVVPDWRALNLSRPIDLIAVGNGGLAVAASDMFFSPMNNLIMPGKATNMGDGWETRRRRGPGNDWVIVKLGRPGVIQKVEVDTAHFRGNFPEFCSLDGSLAPDGEVDALTWPSIDWKEIVPRVKLSASKNHVFDSVKNVGTVSHVRLNIFPDGGVSRLRVFGIVHDTR